MMTIVTVGSYDGATSHTFTAAAVKFDRRVPAVAFADLPWRALARNLSRRHAQSVRTKTGQRQHLQAEREPERPRVRPFLRMLVVRLRHSDPGISESNH